MAASCFLASAWWLRLVVCTHVSCTQSAGTWTRVTWSSLSALEAIVKKWGEAQMPRVRPEDKADKEDKPPPTPFPLNSVPTGSAGLKPPTKPLHQPTAPLLAMEEKKKRAAAEAAAKADEAAAQAPAASVAAIVPVAKVAPPQRPLPPGGEQKQERGDFAKSAKVKTLGPSPESKMSISEYYEPDSFIFLEFEQLLTNNVYRLVHSQGVATMKEVLMTHSFLKQHPFTVRRDDDVPNNKGKFTIVDGMHRATAMMEIRNEYGEAVFNARMQKNSEGKASFPCLVIRKDTPDYLLTSFACSTNDSNAQFTAMTWMDARSILQNL